MSSSTSIATIHNHCDSAIEAIQKLGDVKQILFDYEADSQRLSQEVRGLQREKESLSQEIVEMKKQLQELGDELTETQEHVLTHIYTTTCSTMLDDNDADALGCFPESSNGTLVSVEREHEDDYCATRLDSSMLDIMAGDDSSSSSSSIADSSLAATSASSSSNSTTTVHKRRRSSSKWYKSPKKWRRMMRSQRLQSILLD